MRVYSCVHVVQVRAIKDMASYVAQIKRLGTGHGVCARVCVCVCVRARARMAHVCLLCVCVCGLHERFISECVYTVFWSWCFVELVFTGCAQGCIRCLLQSC